MIGLLIAALAGQNATPARMVAPGPLSRAEAQARVTARFAILDANHDGAIDMAEATGAATAAGIEAARNPGRRMVSDIPGSGSDTAWFAQTDTNGDGRVTLAELSAAPLANFDRLDRNHDGTLSPDERALDPQVRP